MRLLVNSSTPFGYSGYSQVNKNLIPLLNDTTHHDFIYFSRSGRYSSVPSKYQGVPIYSPPSASGAPERYLKPLVEHLDIDFVLHMMDAWILDKSIKGMNFGQISYCPIDCTPLSPRWLQVLSQIYTAIPYSEFGMRQIEDAGLSNYRDPIYHGCITGGTEIQTEKGTRKIRDVYREHDDYVLTQNGFQRILDYHSLKAREDLIKITMENGRTLELTPDDELKTREGWKKAEFLSEKESLLVDTKWCRGEEFERRGKGVHKKELSNEDWERNSKGDRVFSQRSLQGSKQDEPEENRITRLDRRGGEDAEKFLSEENKKRNCRRDGSYRMHSSSKIKENGSLQDQRRSSRKSQLSVEGNHKGTTSWNNRLRWMVRGDPYSWKILSKHWSSKQLSRSPQLVPNVDEGLRPLRGISLPGFDRMGEYLQDPKCRLWGLSSGPGNTSLLDSEERTGRASDKMVEDDKREKEKLSSTGEMPGNSSENSGFEFELIKEIEYTRKKRVFDLKTPCGSFLANGFKKHNCDTEIYQPRDKKVLSFDVEDPFIVGIVKANIGTRANYDHTLEAIRWFLDDNPEATEDFRLYLHTAKQGKSSYNIEALLSMFELSEYTRFPNQTQYQFGEITPRALSEIYSSMDVLLNSTRAEGFGLPVLEALACGTPALITDGSAMKDIFDEGVRKIETLKNPDGFGEDDAFEVRPRKLVSYSWPRRDKIKEKLEWAYYNRDELPKLGEEGRKWAQQYDWTEVAKDWIDVLEEIENEALFSEEDLLEDLDEDLGVG